MGLACVALSDQASVDCLPRGSQVAYGVCHQEDSVLTSTEMHAAFSMLKLAFEQEPTTVYNEEKNWQAYYEPGRKRRSASLRLSLLMRFLFGMVFSKPSLRIWFVTHCLAKNISIEAPTIYIVPYHIYIFIYIYIYAGGSFSDVFWVCCLAVARGAQGQSPNITHTRSQCMIANGLFYI